MRWGVRVGILSLAVIATLTYGLGAAAAEKTKIVYFHRSNTTEADWAKQITQKFNATHPNIEVVALASGTGGGKDFVEKLAVLRASGNAPDVFFGSSDKLGFVLNGWALDITKYVAMDKATVNANAFFPGVFDSFNVGGKIYGVPLTVTPQMLFYNKDMFEKQGLAPLPASWDDKTWTWSTFLDYCKKLTKADGANFTQLALAQATESILPDVTWMFGGDWFDEEAYRTGRATKATMVRDENIQAFEALRDLYERYAAAGPAKNIDSWGGFSESKIAMDWIGAWKLNGFVEQSRSGGMKFKWGLAPVPLVKNRQNTRWTDPLMIDTMSTHPDAAWEFIKYATSDEAQTLWTQITRYIPARRNALAVYVRSINSLSGLSETETSTAVGGALTYSRRSLEESIADAPLEITRNSSTWIDPMLNGQVAVKSGLSSMEQALNAFLKGLKK